VGVLSVALLLTSVCGVTTASAEGASGDKTPGPVASDEWFSDAHAQMQKAIGVDGIKNNEDLMLFRTWIDALKDLNDSGFYDAQVDVSTRHMTLMWKGESPLQQVISEEGAKRKIPVSIVAVPYDYSDIQAAMGALAGRDLDTSQGMWHVTNVKGPNLDEPQITAFGYFINNTSGKMTATEHSYAQMAASRMVGSVVASVPVMVKDGQPAAPWSLRSTDSAPFYAGGQMVGPGGVGACSSGFAINYAGARHTTTARHCDATPFHAADNASFVYGTVVAKSAAGQAAVLSSSGAAFTFDGTWSSGTYRAVAGAVSVSIGNYVCNSGANTGLHCGLRVDHVMANGDGQGIVTDAIGVVQPGSGIAGGEGDSGGPVFTVGQTDNLAYAVGMIQSAGSWVQTPCPSGSVRIPGKCAQGAAVTKIQNILSSLGATLVTS